MPLRQTHTLAILELSPMAYEEIARKLNEAGYSHAFDDRDDKVTIDMTGIGVQVTDGSEERRLRPVMRSDADVLHREDRVKTRDELPPNLPEEMITTFAPPFLHLNFLPSVLSGDLNFIIDRDQQYGASWLKRGGVGAMMMLLRKSDRLEEGVKQDPFKYDVFAFLEAHPDRVDDIDDLRRYLALVRAEWDRRQMGEQLIDSPARIG